MVSVSLTDKNVEVLEELMEEFGLGGRSEAIRVCLRSAGSELKEREALTGTVEGVLIVVHDSHSSPKLDEARHDYQSLITTQIHSHLKNNKCLEVFIIHGDADKVKDMLRIFQGNDRLDYVKFVQS